MNLEENSYQQDSKQWQDKCNRLLYYHVVLTLKNVIEDESRFGRPLGGGGGRFRRFGPRGFPFASIAALSLLAYPFFFPPYPYPYPYYPY